MDDLLNSLQFRFVTAIVFLSVQVSLFVWGAEESDSNNEISAGVRTEESEEFLVNEIVISGQKRTKENAIRRFIKVKEGDLWSEDLEEKIKQRLLKKGIFREQTLEVKSERSEDGYRIDIFLEDRWSLIPIPVLSFGGADWKAGFGLLESNLFGQGITFVSFFIIGNEYLNVGLNFIYDRKTMLFAHYSYKEIIDKTTYGNRTENLRTSRRQAPMFKLRHGFDLNDEWILSAVMSYDAIFVESVSINVDDPGNLLALEKEQHFLSVGSLLKYDNSKIEGVFVRGLRANLGANYVTPMYVELMANGTCSFLLWNNLIAFDINGGWAEQPNSLGFTLGARSGSITLPSGVFAKSYVSSAFRFQRVIIPLGSVSVVGSVFYEGGFYVDGLDRNVSYHGPGLGIAVVLDKVAIPAVSFLVGWNIPMNGEFFYAFNLGFQL